MDALVDELGQVKRGLLALAGAAGHADAGAASRWCRTAEGVAVGSPAGTDGRGRRGGENDWARH